MIEAFALFGEISLRGGEAVQRGLTNVNDAAENSGRRMGGLGKAVAGLGSAMAGGALANGFFAASKSILGATADIQSMDSQYTQVMGNMKKQTDGFIEAGAKAWGKHPNQ